MSTNKVKFKTQQEIYEQIAKETGYTYQQVKDTSAEFFSERSGFTKLMLGKTLVLSKIGRFKPSKLFANFLNSRRFIEIIRERDHSYKHRRRHNRKFNAFSGVNNFKKKKIVINNK